MTATGPAPAAAGIPTADAPTELSLPGSRRRLGRVSIAQLVVVQLAAVAAAAVYPTPDTVFLPVLALALAVTAAMFARRGGRWWYEELAHRLRFRRRARRLRRHPPADRLAVLAPGVSFEDVTDRGTRVGVGVDRNGWYGAVVVTPGEQQGQHPGPGALVSALAEVAAPVSTVQLVHHVVPASTMSAEAGEWTWVAVRVDTRDAPLEAASRGGGVAGVYRTVAAAVGRVLTGLRAAGADGRALISSELPELLAVVGGWSGDQAAPGRAAPEHWSGWQGTDAVHMCFRVTGTCRLDQLVEALRATPVRSATVAVRFAPPAAAAIAAEHRVTREGLLQVAAWPDQVDTTVEQVSAAASAAGGTLRRLDGVHAPAIYATAPTGFTLPHRA